MGTYVLSKLRFSTLTLNNLRQLSSSPSSVSSKLVICGGGAGGISVAAKFAEVFGKGNVTIIEPSDTHYYQPMWTLVGAGIKRLSESAKPMSKVMPPKVKWIRASVVQFDPKSNKIRLSDNSEVTYEYLVVALGIQIDWNRIKGLPQAFGTPGVCSNYSTQTVVKTLPAIERLESGNAIFTFPNTPVKCAGAPQKIMYLVDAHLRKMGKREKTNVIFNSALSTIFSVQKYATALNRIVKDRNITVNYQHNLVEVKPDTKEAVFENLGTKELKTFKYELLHVTPPMSAPKVLAPLADSSGFVSLNKETLQHTQYPNIFGIGDCTNLPTSKTAAAVAGQNGVLARNLLAVSKGKSPYAKYDGYTSCPLVTGNNKCILAEFDYDLQPLETFPIDQGKERFSMYYLKKEIMPKVYWNSLLKGMWNGPEFYRRIMHFGFTK